MIYDMSLSNPYDKEMELMLDILQITINLILNYDCKESKYNHIYIYDLNKYNHIILCKM